MVKTAVAKRYIPDTSQSARKKIVGVNFAYCKTWAIMKFALNIAFLNK